MVLVANPNHMVVLGRGLISLPRKRNEIRRFTGQQEAEMLLETRGPGE